MTVTDLFPGTREEMPIKTVHHSANDETARFYAVLNTEHELKLFCGNELLHTFICSPSFLGDMCVGWLAGEGYAVDSVNVAEDGKAASAAIRKIKNNRFKPHETAVSPFDMLDLFENGSEKYSRSHGIHECVLKCGEDVIIRTDLGRFNAVDKAVGAALIQGYELADSVLFTSGRINTQLVQKAFGCGIPTLMSKAVITKDALDLAQSLGLNIFFGVRFDSFLTP